MGLLVGVRSDVPSQVAGGPERFVAKVANILHVAVRYHVEGQQSLQVVGLVASVAGICLLTVIGDLVMIF